MNIELTTSCALAGVVAGWLLDGVSVSIPPLRSRATAEPAAEAASLATAPGAVESGRTDWDDPRVGVVAVAESESPPGPDQPRPGASAPAASSRPEDAPEPEDVPLEPWTLVPTSPIRWLERLLATVVTGALLGLAAYRLGSVAQLGAYCVLFVGLVAVSAVDFRVGLVPRLILYPTFLLMLIGLLAASAVQDAWTSMIHAAIAGVAAYFVFYAIRWFRPRDLGGGDVRLAGVMGVGMGWLGLPEAYLGFLAAFLLGTLYGLVIMVIQGTGRKTRLAFGPALAAGAVIGILWGPTLAQTWLHHSGG